VEVRDPEGTNLALVSRGAGVTVSSTSDAHNTDRYSANTLWGPLQYDLGNKWTKVGSDNGSSLWCFTEHEKGVLKIDEDFDNAISEAVKNGIHVMLTLDFKGNWIYEKPPRKSQWFEARFREINESYLCGIAVADDSPEMFEGYLNYVEYMVHHFKDRVKYFEIGNEWNGWHHGDYSLNWYKNDILEPTCDLIKKIAPEVKISLGSPTGFFTEEILSCLGSGVRASEGTLSVPGRMLAAVKGVRRNDVVVSVDVETEAPVGIVLRFRGRDNFLAAIFDPGNAEIYFLECIGFHVVEKDVIAKYSHKGTVSVEGMRTSVHMEVRSAGRNVTCTVSDGEKTASTLYTVNTVDAEGSIGLLQYPGQANGAFLHFRVTDSAGHLIFKDDFEAHEELAKRWNIHWNHWDNHKAPLAQRIDAIGWHGGDLPHPHKEYFSRVKAFRKACEQLGFTGEYFCNEIYAGSVYPPGPDENYGLFRLTEYQEAKYLVNTIVGYSCLNIEAGPCHVHLTGYPHPQALCRTTWPSHVVTPIQPKPSYYCLRTIATAMDDFYEAEFPVTFTDDSDITSFTLESGDKTHLMIAAWIERPLADQAAEKKTSVLMRGSKAEAAWGVDLFNGTEQALHMVVSEEGTVIEDIMLKDYPVLLRFKIR
jgi:hypothetical protein